MEDNKDSTNNNAMDTSSMEIDTLEPIDLDVQPELPAEPELNMGDYINDTPEELVQKSVTAFSEKGDSNKAVALARLACRKDVTYDLAWSQLGMLLIINRRVDAAIGCLKKSLRLKPENYAVWVNLGNALLRSNRFEEALESFERASEIEAGNASIYLSIAGCHRDLGQYDKALDALRRSELLGNNDAELSWSRTLLNLMRGDYKEGFKGLDKRWEREGAQPRYPLDKKWDGKVVRGTRILVWSDSGFNDIIMMSRFAPLLAEQGMEVILEIPAESGKLFEESPAFKDVKLKYFTKEATPYDGIHTPLASLPYLMGYNDSTKIPNAPYLTAPKAPRVRGTLFKVGIVWNGASRRVPDPNRVLSLRHVARIADSPNTEFYSLQRGGAEEELRASGIDHVVANIGGISRDLADIAAFCENLDLVVSVDSYQAHIAAAMGKKVWLLLGPNPDWRWQLKPSSSPWYENVKLYRRTDRLHWDDIVEKVRLDLIKESKKAIAV